MLGPSGPRRLRLAVEHLCQYRGGICFCVDLDPRWVIKLIKKGWMEHLKAYQEHVIDQAGCRGIVRHTAHGGVIRLGLGKGQAAILLDGLQTKRSVAAGSREDDANRIVSLILGQCKKK